MGEKTHHVLLGEGGREEGQVSLGEEGREELGEEEGQVSSSTALR